MKAALLYARMGWRVVPLHSVRPDGTCTCEPRRDGKECKSQGKHPRFSDWVDLASNDPEEVQRWAERWPAANVGIATGSASGFFVLDVDPDKGGTETLAGLVAEHGELPPTACAQTGSGGYHYLFALPDFSVTNDAGRRVGKGLDIRGDGGQIVVAPSRSNKGSYRWVRPPFNGGEILEAPHWLIARLSRPPPKNANSPFLSLDRGFFPAASPEVLDQAREALEQHGPAIDGEGGGLHTVHAAAILTHDFALTDEEAWPLFLEWNQTCVPPWEEDDLEVRLTRGRKYGKAEFGCKRTLDTLEVARKLIKDWQTVAGGEETLLPLVEQVRKLTAMCGDPLKRGIILRELQAASGWGPRDLALPNVKAVVAEAKPPGSIVVTTNLHEVADESTKAIAGRVFQRNGVLCEVVKAERTFIHDMDGARIQDLMSASAKYVRNDEAKGLITMAPPERVATILAARRTHKGVRILEAVTTAPIFLADGSILQERGYNAQARVFLEPGVAVDVPDYPTLQDAKAAVDVFRDLLCNFNFLSPADFSSWLAALLTPLVKASIGNAPSPLFCVSASTPGAGKSKLTETISRIVTGDDPQIRSYNPKDPAEWGKRLTSYVKSAAPINVFDNINGPIGDEGLDRLITAATWSDRLLGASEAPPLPNVGTWMATGNNIEPIGDTVRRALMTRLDVLVERPQEVTGFKHDLEGGYALEHRSELLSAALTILRAYHVAGRPDQNLPTWGSFTAWSRLVRGALVWAGAADPYLTQQRAAAEFNESDSEANDFWIDVVEMSDGTIASIVALANQRDARGVLNARDDISAFNLKRFIGRFVDKPRAGKRIRRERDGNTARFHVEVI